MSEPPEPTTPGSKELTGRIGKYEIKHSIGKGAMGHVYLAHDTVLDRDVALKVMASQIADDAELKVRFEREAKAVAQMTHPNVVTVFDLGALDDGSPYFAMELLKGQDLQKTVRQTPTLSLERKVDIIIQVLSGLNHAHQAEIFHRDIKPANIFILQDGKVKIMDFGVARMKAAPMTGTGNIVGTADYMSPEQVQGHKIDGRSDLFSVGCLLYELVTGRRPFHSDNLMAIFYKITHEGPNFDLIPPGPEHDALLPILKKALARNIDERYQTAYEFAMDLRQWLRAHGTTAATQHVLESLVDLEAPTHTPQPMAEFGAPPSDRTVDLAPGRRPGVSRRATMRPTQVSGRTVVDGGAIARPSPRGVAIPAARRRARPVRRRSPLPWVALGVVVIAAVGGSAYYFLVVLPASASPPVTRAAATPAPPPTTVATPTPPPVTAAPQPTFAPPEGKAAASLRAANTAFDRGQYDRAVESAQRALREDPSNATAREILDKAEKGQQAATRVRAGEAALASGEFDTAEREAQAARRLAPWDGSVADLRRRIDAARREAQRTAEAQAQQQRAARINTLLDEGATALENKQYDAAIAAYEEVLALDPGNTAAQTGRTGAISARSLAEVAASGAAKPPGPAHGFATGTSVAQAAQAESGSTPPGFEDTPEVEVHAGTQAAALPGRLDIEASPASPQPGDRYTISAFLANEGAQPIELERLVVTTIIDGQKRGPAPVEPRASVVAPRQRALVFQLPPQMWKQATRSWEMEIVVFTSRKNTYRNTLTWK
jgi:tetratricopeptide (TPR) repeat protein/tRNA A-37 threonylcarbamoyl transferase component Bud32